jgi:hypothetical protein
MSAKVTYINGSYLTPSALNGYFGVSAGTGHAHDGGSDQTCAPKVNLTSHVTGVLPVANMATESGTFSVAVTKSDFTADTTGTAYWARSGNIVTLNLPLLQGTSNSLFFRIYATDSSGYPARVIPSTAYSYNKVYDVYDNNVYYSSGYVRIPIGVTDPIEVFKGNSTSFTAAGAKSIGGWTSVTYLIA